MHMRKHLFVAVAITCLIALAGCSSGASSSASATSAASSSQSATSSSTASGTASASSTSTSKSSASSSDVSSSSTNIPGAPSADTVLPEDKWGSLFSVVGDDAIAFGKRVQTELPVAAYAEYDSMAGGTPVKFTDPGTIRAMFNSLASANAVEDPNYMVSTDDYTKFWFKFQDDSQFGFFFDSMAYEKRVDGSYKVYPVEMNQDLAWFAYAAMNRTTSDRM